MAGKQTIEALGIIGIDLTPEIAEMFSGLRRRGGVVVVRTTPEAPYSQQGTLESGDVIHEINGKEIVNIEGLKAALSAVKIGTAVSCR